MVVTGRAGRGNLRSPLPNARTYPTNLSAPTTGGTMKNSLYNLANVVLHVVLLNLPVVLG